MNRQLIALILPLVALFLTVIGMAHLQKVWKPAVIVALGAGAVIWWFIFYNLLSQVLW